MEQRNGMLGHNTARADIYHGGKRVKEMLSAESQGPPMPAVYLVDRDKAPARVSDQTSCP